MRVIPVAAANTADGTDGARCVLETSDPVDADAAERKAMQLLAEIAAAGSAPITFERDDGARRLEIPDDFASKARVVQSLLAAAAESRARVDRDTFRSVRRGELKTPTKRRPKRLHADVTARVLGALERLKAAGENLVTITRKRVAVEAGLSESTVGDATHNDPETGETVRILDALFAARERLTGSRRAKRGALIFKDRLDGVAVEPRPNERPNPIRPKKAGTKLA